MSTKTRSLDTKVSYPSFYTPTGGVNVEGGTNTWKGRQLTASEGHKRVNGRYVEGGPFFTYRHQTNIRTRQVHVNYKGHTYDGAANVPLVPTNAGGINVPSQNLEALDQYGTTAIAAVDPTNANADLGVVLGEIGRDGIPIPVIQTWKNRTKVAKAAGSEYLAAVFGWLPLVDEMKDVGQSVHDGNVILKGYRDNAGGLGVHREFAFDDVVTESEGSLGLNSAEVLAGKASLDFAPTQKVPITRRQVTTVKRWFSGSFTYASPNDPSDRIGRMLGLGSEADKLFGLSLTPDVVWELSPWSWAVDWFSNAGDVISNVTSFKLGGLVMRYGYIMEETSTVTTYSMPAPALYGVGGSMPPSTVEVVTKKRRPANPFGFGVSWEGLSPTQLAITAALGISRLR